MKSPEAKLVFIPFIYISHTPTIMKVISPVIYYKVSLWKKLVHSFIIHGHNINSIIATRKIFIFSLIFMRALENCKVKNIKLKQNLIMGEIKPRWFIWTLLCVFVTWTFTTGWIKGITVITCSQLIKQKLGQPKTVSQVVSLENRENGR